ncbi:hypothetical protein SAMN05878503_12730 [Cereibacter ovatus]|uniref:Methyl-accepting chemotaxis protein n=1 Tax=Cereibacter ovatus TaxID=439529 RepID=A0A285D526_9RHOB|nr:chemotaxis protein [Cereibacter ovatus]SNX74890.1 hypothetical protein SAMN05878503_12730 [Cereibacter ovatus]
MALPNQIDGTALHGTDPSGQVARPPLHQMGKPVVSTRLSRSAIRRVAKQISGLACATEKAFLRAGSSLEQAIGRFDRLSIPLTNLLALVDAGEFADAAAEAARLEERALSFAANGGPLFDRIAALAARSDVLNADLAAMRQVIRTMSIVALNARVTVASLTEQNTGLDVFTTAATSQVLEASGIIGQISETVEVLGHRIQVAAAEAQSLSHLLGRNLGQTLAGLRLDMAAFEIELARTTTEGSVLVRHGDDFRRAITTAVLSLQIGDTTRQRLEHIAAFLEPSAGVLDVDPAAARIILALAAGQLRDAHERHAAAIVTARCALRDSGQETAEIGRISARIATAPRHNLKHHLQRLRELLCDCRSAQGRLVDVAEGLSEGLNNLLQILGRMTGVEERMGMIGLNAVIACVQLGDEALALREISLQLRELAATSADRLRQINEGLSDMANEAGKTTADLSGNFRIDLDQLTQAGERVFNCLSRIETGIQTTGATIERERRMAERDVAAGVSALDGHSSAFADLAGLTPELEFWSSLLSERDAGPETPQTMAGIRNGYTMAAERLVHDTILRDLLPQAVETEPAEMPPAADDDDLSAVLF